MFVFTHLMFANYFIEVYEGFDEGIFEFDPIAFRFGNVLPDLSSMSKINHYFEDTQQVIAEHKSKIINKNLSGSARSQALGVLCHFYCDYFCKYHRNPSDQKKSIYQHLLYELELHILFVIRKFKGHKYFERKLSRLNQIVHHMRVEADDHTSHRTVAFHTSLFHLYDLEDQTIEKDIMFALLSSKHLITEYLHCILTAKNEELASDLFASNQLELSNHELDVMVG